MSARQHAARERDADRVCLTARRVGRGNWRALDIALIGRHAPLPLTLKRGDLVSIGADRYRIVHVST